MSDPRTSGRIEPSLSTPEAEAAPPPPAAPQPETRPAPPPPQPAAETRAAPAPQPAPRPAPPPQPAQSQPPQQAVPASQRPGLDQLARIEEKAARIEEKFARSEALMLRLEAQIEKSTGITGSLARQEDVAAVDYRVSRLPGYGTLIVVAALAAIGGAVLAVILLRYAGGLGL
ncbi:MAG: hypothetical protein KF735_11890 [Chelatococcus sp.]|jgi:outer membrane biosynthesis protein TonB|uniref:hypothetical protein n=1 Tax=unclassified Chelatococcus TaxID=2638111 RepID=UPI001BCB966B|nr:MULTISPECIES: hypothetical protein [unclassified Chelatococcus]CAH1660325.1 conserved hypothetical protein [Hyphomicrobiales bacterium]MBS7741086.1 hypothetical protein [Chelatococcus sp. HY11]MBX3538338.1 hypothetical protein [Chelatococcus sp.]MBX3545272.1 hypothetical protein [Chelatococcus sp.]MCO5077905.1 hypothetical protein [Chelatococcus sp.]